MGQEESAPPGIRIHFDAELDQVRLQVEVMAVRVGEALSRMRTVLATGDLAVAALALGADDEIDAMLVSLTERCYDMLRRQAPVASDLRFIVSVLRLLEELERMGDLALRVIKHAPEIPAGSELFVSLDSMAEIAQELYRTAVGAWSSQNLELASTLVARNQDMEGRYTRLLEQILRLDGPGATQIAVSAVLMGKALDRIADHSVIVGERLQYLLTADPAYLASEVR
ncbi:MAG TPA: PhoU domain-containing protein [Actinomycetota bacterium]|jgi:phosphate transport system protein|nr:PhoU domain-containing protein [Actinomycetota bacterium]